jgi:hypothetical protein
MKCLKMLQLAPNQWGLQRQAITQFLTIADSQGKNPVGA